MGDGVNHLYGALSRVERGLELHVGALNAFEALYVERLAAVLLDGVNRGGRAPAVASALLGGSVERATVVRASFGVVVRHLDVMLGSIHVLAADLHGPGALNVGASLGVGGDSTRHATGALGAGKSTVVALAEVAVVAASTSTVPAVGNEGGTVEALLKVLGSGGRSGLGGGGLLDGRGRGSSSSTSLSVDQRLEADGGGDGGGSGGKGDFSRPSVNIGKGSLDFGGDSGDFLLVVEMFAEVLLSVHGLVVKPEIGFERDDLLGRSGDLDRVGLPGVYTTSFEGNGFKKTNVLAHIEGDLGSGTPGETVAELVELTFAKGAVELDEHGLSRTTIGEVSGLHGNFVLGKGGLLEAFLGINSLDANSFGIRVGLESKLLLVTLSGHPVVGTELNGLARRSVYVNEVDGTPAISAGGLKGDTVKQTNVFLHFDTGGAVSTTDEVVANGVIFGSTLGANKSHLDGLLRVSILNGTSAVVNVVLLGESRRRSGTLGPLAALVVAALNALEDGAFVTTKAVEGDHRTGGNLDTTAAGLRALVKLAPGRNSAVNGTGDNLALLQLRLRGAGLAAVEGFSSDLAGALLNASTAGAGAGGPLGPGADSAVSGTGEGVAVTRGFETYALGATVDRGFGDSAGAGLHTRAASLGALGPGGVRRVLAVDGAGTSIAVLFLFGVRTFNTAVGALLHNNAGTDVSANTTGLGAGTVSSPFAGLTIDGTCLGIAGLGFLAVLAEAVVQGSAGDDLLAALEAATTRYGAGGERTP